MGVNVSLSRLRTWTKSSRRTRRNTCSKLLGYKGWLNTFLEAHGTFTAYVQGPDMNTYFRWIHHVHHIPCNFELVAIEATTLYYCSR